MKAPEFTKKELERYSRHLILPEFNIEGQRKLKASKVLVVGVGGLGAPLLYYLTAAGVGAIGMVDADVVEESNLQRQVLFNTHDIGRPKVEAAREKLEALDPNVTFHTHQVRLTSENALDILHDYDVIADGTDNFPTRYLVNDACIILGKPNVYGSVFRFEGQVAVFNYLDKEGTRGPNYRDLFPAPPPPGSVPSCAEGGVLGVLPGIIGSMQANEVIKILTGIGEPLAGRLFTLDSLTFETRTLNIGKNPDSPEVNELIDYEAFCGLSERQEVDDEKVKELSVEELGELKDKGVPFQLIDVREPYEYEIANLGGELIPLERLPEEINRIESEKRVIVHCRTGGRSTKAIKLLQEKFGFTNLFNLTGGILEWAEKMDPEMAKY